MVARCAFNPLQPNIIVRLLSIFSNRHQCAYFFFISADCLSPRARQGEKRRTTLIDLQECEILHHHMPEGLEYVQLSKLECGDS